MTSPTKQITDQYVAPQRNKTVNAAPEYVRRAGGAQWILTASCGAEVSATRGSLGSRWSILDCSGSQTFGPSIWSNGDVLIELRHILREALTASLLELGAE